MGIIGDLLLTNLLAYLINLASGERSAAITATREQKLMEALKEEESLRRAIASTYSIRDEIRYACTELADSRGRLGVTSQEAPLWQLLSNEVFQTDLTEWLMAGAIEEGNAVKDRLLQRMEDALANGGSGPEQIAFLRTGYLEAVDKAVFSHPFLAHWRHQLSLDYLRQQVAVLRLRAEEAAGVFSPQKQRAALDRYCEKALAVWDIIDLSNLPEGDIHMATQKLLLRQLYMPLRIEVEFIKRGEGNEVALARLEAQREIRRHREAGHFFADRPDRASRRGSRAPLGERLSVSPRLVVLGDPGGGKTTMLRWLATAYLLQYKGDNAFTQIPDTQTLPNQPWIPVLIRCRDLGEADLCRSFTDFLTQHLNKTELLPEEANIMRAVILDRIANGKALLLVDGLDEIANPEVRMMFCQELERTAARYPDAPIVVTSRIVGYRDMPYRMGSGFEHGVIAEMNRADKDLFAQRWVEVTEQYQPAAEKAKHVQELLDALHSSERIERLTGNPMLLTTLALVKRKVGKLPTRRTKLYSEAVAVLLNWNPRLYKTIDEREALPQLEYLAYEMCRRGVQRLADDEVLDLLDKLRVEYPNVRAIHIREPQAFLTLLEARSSILIKSGGVWQKDKSAEKPVWEFRHLTFQEYLAARALLEGHYAGRNKTKSLAEQVAPLAAMQLSGQNPQISAPDAELEVAESWREALRLLVADCKDDDVDEVLLAILNPLSGEDAEKTSRPRLVLSTLCLADEPNVSDKTVEVVFSAFVRAVTKEVQGHHDTTVEQTAAEVGRSAFVEKLLTSLLSEWFVRDSELREPVGTLIGNIRWRQWERTGASFSSLASAFEAVLKTCDYNAAIVDALGIMIAAFEGRSEKHPSLIDTLFDFSKVNQFTADAAVWALWWLAGGSRDYRDEHDWKPDGLALTLLDKLQQQLPEEEWKSHRAIIRLLGLTKDSKAIAPLTSALHFSRTEIRISAAEELMKLKDQRAVPSLLGKLDDQDADVRITVIEALGELGDKQAVASLLALLNDQNANVRVSVIEALRQLGDKRAVVPLLAKLDDQGTDVFIAVVRALEELGDKQAVAPLLAKLNDQDADICIAVVRALGQLGDKQAVAPLLAKLDDQDANVRMAVVRALGELGDKQSVAPLLAKLDDRSANVRMALIKALGQLGEKEAVAPLLVMLDDQDVDIVATAEAALLALGEAQRRPAGLTRFLTSDEANVRRTAVGAYGRQKERADRRLLSRDLDAVAPWLDPDEPVTEEQVTNASLQLNMSADEVRSRYEAMADALNLKLNWKN